DKVDAAIKILEANTEKEIKNVVIPRLKLIKTLLGKDDKAKELAKLIRDNFLEKIETDYEDNTYKTNLTNLEDKLTNLKKYGKGGVNESVYTSLGTDEKATFDGLVSSLQKKVDAMKKEQNKENTDENSNKDKPFFKTPLGYVTAAVIVLAIIGAIAYFIKANSSEEGE